MWIEQQLIDFKIKISKIPIKCDNTSAINISKNPIQHSRTKHIDIKHHFTRGHIFKGDIKLEFVYTTDHFVDTLTKPLDKNNFISIHRRIDVCDLNEF